MNDDERTAVVESMERLEPGKRSYVRWEPKDRYASFINEGGWCGYLGEPNEPGTYVTHGHSGADDALLGLLASVSENHKRKREDEQREREAEKS